MEEGKFELYRDKRGQWRFRLKAANGKIIAASSESYVDRRDAERGIEIVRASACFPLVSDGE